MERDELQKRIARLTTLENVGCVFRDGLAVYERAKAFATKAQSGQMYGEKPFTYHLEQVENVLIRFDYCSFRIRAAAWLYETVETPDLTMSDISREFPGFIASTVDALASAPGRNREERNAAMYLRIKTHGVMAIVLKLADRIAHVEENSAAILNDHSKLSIYETEHSDFRDALYKSGDADAMWAHLDTLIEVRTEALNRRNLAAFANGLSSSNNPTKLDVTSSLSRSPRE
jgi:guanosine-3',5'-bis(diphosphate) 3'-pyrophosphohydrolase